MLTQAQLKAVIDATFGVIGSLESGHPLVQAAIGFFGTTVDNNFDAVVAELAKIGITVGS